VTDTATAAAGVVADEGTPAVDDVRTALADRIVVLVPAYCEAENIGHVLAQMPSQIDDVDTVVLVVDDGSADATAREAADAGALVVRHVRNRGGGAALRTGYALAIAGGARVVVTLDADGQHLPGEMARLVDPVLSGDAEFAAGSRVLGSSEPGVFARELGIAVFNRLVSLLLLRRITDCSNGYRAITTDALATLDLRQDQFHASEFLIEAVTRGVRTIEVPITVERRLHGETKKPRTLRYGVGFANAIVRAWARSVIRRAGPSRRRDRRPAAPEPGAA
jgi:glycosyltransferase involved in cell wall biosynthesis